MSASSITIARTSQEDIRQRQIVVSLDGDRIGTLLFNQTLTHPLEPGRHKLRVHNTLVWKSVEFDVPPGAEVRFVVINRAGFGTYAMLTLLGTGPLYLTLRREP